jgi:TDG/mug DNA glycosylase family protein
MTEEQQRGLIDIGIGITNLVNRATVRASELSREELREGGDRLIELVEVVKPAVVAVAGVTAFRLAFGSPKARLGRQERDLGPAQFWAVPNPSGLNAHETIASLAGWYAKVGGQAGIR